MVVMINIDMERFKLGPFLKKNPATATILLSDGAVEQNYGVQGIPLTLVLDRKGQIRYRKNGFGPEGEHELRGAIDALLDVEKATAAQKAVGR